MNPPEPTAHSSYPTLYRQIPTVSYTIQNILISCASLGAAFASLFFTSFVILPLACVRMLVPVGVVAHKGRGRSGSGQGQRGKGRVVLIVGASRGIGFNVLKQYADEEDTVIIAASRSIDALREAVIDLGDTRATLQCVKVDLTVSNKQIAETIKDLDKQYGPITHLYEVSGISNRLRDSTAWRPNVTEEMTYFNISGTIASVLAMFELMKERRYGKICILGSVADLYGPDNMISYTSNKSFINTFSTSLRVLAINIEMTTVQPSFIDACMTEQIRNQESSVPGKGHVEFRAATCALARAGPRK